MCTPGQYHPFAPLSLRHSLHGVFFSRIVTTRDFGTIAIVRYTLFLSTSLYLPRKRARQHREGYRYIRPKYCLSFYILESLFCDGVKFSLSYSNESMIGLN